MCDFDKRLIPWMDGELEPGEMLEVEQHLPACTECSARVREYRKVSRAFADYCEAIASPSFSRRVPWAAWGAAPAVAATAAMFLWMLRPPSPTLKLTRPAVDPARMLETGKVVTGFKFPRAKTPRRRSRPLRAETSLPVTIFPSWPSIALARMLETGNGSSVRVKSIRRQMAGHRAGPASAPSAQEIETIQPAIEIAIPAEALFAPGAVPAGFSLTAELSIAGDGSPLALRLQP